MLSLQTQQKYIQKVMRLPNGALALVVFELKIENGKVIAKAVSGKIIESPISKKQEVRTLPAEKIIQKIKPIVSPFFSYIPTFIKDFSFFVSQPVRAPNF